MVDQTNRNTTAARTIALYLYLQEQGNLQRPEGVTLQKIANVTGGVNRSTVMREIENMETVAPMVKEYLAELRKL